MSRLILPAVPLLVTAAAAASAELLAPQSGRAISVRAVRTENYEIVLELRVAPDAVDCPNEVARDLKKLLSRYELPLPLAVYNAGEAAVNRCGGIPILSRS
jgi:hypothetical protein